MSNKSAVSLGLGARNLRDRDWLSKSDPYILISRPSTTGSFQVLRRSETKKNSLNPDWADFLINESEIGPHEQDLRLKIEIFDDDFNSEDQLLGVTHLSLKQLEAAATLQNSLPLGNGKGKCFGSLLVRSFSKHGGQGEANYLRNPAGVLGHPGRPGHLSHSGSGHLGHSGHPAQVVGYPCQPSGYPLPGQPTTYPAQAGGNPYPNAPYPGPAGGCPGADIASPGQGSLPYPAQPAEGVPGVFYPPKPHIPGPNRDQHYPPSQPSRATPASAPPLYPPLPLTGNPQYPSFAAPTSSCPQYPSKVTYNGPGGFVIPQF